MRHAAGPGPGPSAVLPPCVRTLYHMSLGVLTKPQLIWAVVHTLPLWNSQREVDQVEDSSVVAKNVCRVQVVVMPAT